MKRRDLIASMGVLAAGGCAPKKDCADGAAGAQRYTWKLVTTWPPNFPGLGTGVQRIADDIGLASGGRLQVRVYAGGELVPALGVFDAVSQGVAEMGHGAAYYWKGKTEAAEYFTSIPFGLNATELNGWLYFGGGMELYREIYARFGLIPFPAGNSGVQMGGWFNKEINSVADLRGLKMRIPGPGGEVLRLAGGTPVNMPASEIYTSLETGVIDATEWIGPWNDRVLGLHKAARYYYYPGWHEPGPMLECIVNKAALDALPEDLRTIVALACSSANDHMPAEFMARNAEALAQMEQEGEVEIRRFPDDVLQELQRLTEQSMAELETRDPDAKRIRESFNAYRQRVARWSAISEQAFLNARTP